MRGRTRHRYQGRLCFLRPIPPFFLYTSFHVTAPNLFKKMLDKFGAM
nr:MAG TPA: hypothetical protein [Caudoviricetes sp.]